MSEKENERYHPSDLYGGLTDAQALSERHEVERAHLADLVDRALYQSIKINQGLLQVDQLVTARDNSEWQLFPDKVWAKVDETPTITIRRPPPFERKVVGTDIGRDDFTCTVRMVMDEIRRLHVHSIIENTKLNYQVHRQPISSAENPKLLLTLKRSNT